MAVLNPRDGLQLIGHHDGVLEIPPLPEVIGAAVEQAHDDRTAGSAGGQRGFLSSRRTSITSAISASGPCVTW